MYLTEFYFWTALGGVLGGVFTATVSPYVFNTVLEYPLLVAALAFFRSTPDRNYKVTDADWNYPAIVAAAITVVWLSSAEPTSMPMSVCPRWFTFSRFRRIQVRLRPFRFALTLAILMIAYIIALPQYVERADRLFVERDFFGVKKVLTRGKFRSLVHGDTTHGVENTERPSTPTSVLPPDRHNGADHEFDRQTLNHVGVLGLGTGTMAGYVTPERRMTFFEIDPQVETIARNYFTFLANCNENCKVIIGDGRLELQRLPDNDFDMLMMDAFSSDAIPAHLLSREAIQMYLKKLATEGILLIHVSNRYLNVQKLAEQLLLDAGLVVFQRNDARR